MDESLHQGKKKRPAPRNPDYDTLDIFTGQPLDKPEKRVKVSTGARLVLEAVAATTWIRRSTLASSPPTGVSSGSIGSLLDELLSGGYVTHRLEEFNPDFIGELPIAVTEKGWAYLRKVRQEEG